MEADGGLSPEQRVELTTLIREAGIPPAREAAVLARCEQLYRDGHKPIPEGTSDFDALAPLAFRTAVDLLAGKERRKAATLIRKQIKKWFA